MIPIATGHFNKSLERPPTHMAEVALDSLTDRVKCQCEVANTTSYIHHSLSSTRPKVEKLKHCDASIHLDSFQQLDSLY